MMMTTTKMSNLRDHKIQELPPVRDDAKIIRQIQVTAQDKPCYLTRYSIFCAISASCIFYPGAIRCLNNTYSIFSRFEHI